MSTCHISNPKSFRMISFGCWLLATSEGDVLEDARAKQAGLENRGVGVMQASPQPLLRVPSQTSCLLTRSSQAAVQLDGGQRRCSEILFFTHLMSRRCLTAISKRFMGKACCSQLDKLTGMVDEIMEGGSGRSSRESQAVTVTVTFVPPWREGKSTGFSAGLPSSLRCRSVVRF